MKSMNRDKNLSGTLIFLTLGFIFFTAGADGGFTSEDSMTLKESILNIFCANTPIQCAIAFRNPAN